MDISRVVVDTDGYEGSVSEELEPIAEQLSRDEVAEPGGQLLVLSDHRGDVGQTCRGDVRLWDCDIVTVWHPPVTRVMQNTGGENLTTMLARALCNISMFMFVVCGRPLSSHIALSTCLLLPRSPLPPRGFPFPNNNGRPSDRGSCHLGFLLQHNHNWYFISS